MKQMRPDPPDGAPDGPVIGLFMSRLDRSFHRASFLSVAQAAREQGAHCICFDGGVLRSPGDPAGQANVLYDLVGPHILDGLVIWSSCIDWSVSPAAMEEFCERYCSIPIVS